MRKAKILSAFIFLFCLAINPGVAETSSHSKHKSSSTHATSKKHGTSKSSKHHYAKRHRANRSQGPTVEEIPQEIFPPGHKFTPEEKAEASEIGAMVENGMWKEAFKAATKAGRQHPERWWLQAARAAAASNLNRPKDTIDAVNAAIQSNGGDANVTVDGASVPAKEYEISGSTHYKIWIDKHDIPVMFVVDDDSGQVTFTLKK